MPNGALNLGSQLGQLLFGAPDDGKAYYEGQALGATALDRMASAAKDRSEAMINQTKNTGLNALRQSYKAMGYTDQQSDVMANSAMANGGVNLENALGSAMMAQIPVAGSQAVPQGASTFQQALGRATAALADGQVYNPLGDSAQPVRLTALGDATVADKQADAGEKMAQAARARAGISADKAGFYSVEDTGDGMVVVDKRHPGQAIPVKLGDHVVHKVTTDKLPPISDVTNILPKTAPAGNPYGQPSANPDDVAGVLGWLAKHPGKNIGDYVNQSPVGSAGALPPLGAMILDAVSSGSPASAAAPSAPPVATPADTAPAARKMPAVGTSEGGYIFKGGDPSKRENWIKASDLQAEVNQ